MKGLNLMASNGLKWRQMLKSPRTNFFQSNVLAKNFESHIFTDLLFLNSVVHLKSLKPKVGNGSLLEQTPSKTRLLSLQCQKTGPRLPVCRRRYQNEKR